VEARLIVDWSAPWFSRWREVGEPVLGAWRSGPLHAALPADGQVAFAPASAPGDDEPYESFIFRTRTVPTRDNAHDFFNALAWLRFPAVKSRLNEVQAAEIARDGIGARRGPIRDAITLLDENGAFIDAPDDIRDALIARDWRRLFVDLRPLWTDVKVTVFGHALLEKLLAPRKDLTAHVWMAPLAFTPESLASKPFAPLPLMGIPGWHAGNENFSFYDDSVVFRAAGHRNRLQQPARNPPP
jgi:hypothetical protein